MTRIRSPTDRRPESAAARGFGRPDPGVTNTSTNRESAMESTKDSNVDFKLEVVVIPVSDVDRAKSFYGGLGWRLEADYASDDGYFRVIQFTPPGSGCSVIFGKNVTGGTRLQPGTVPDCLRHQGRPRRTDQSRRRDQRSVPRRRRRLRWYGRALPLWAAPGWRSGPGASQLPLVRLVPRSGRQRLGVPGDHSAIARTRGRGWNGLHLVDRACAPGHASGSSGQPASGHSVCGWSRWFSPCGTPQRARICGPSLPAASLIGFRPRSKVRLMRPILAWGASGRDL
jgi:catechol 2,3-dioxygenase-like lactoylglutathione lyase family enzyme